MFKMLAQLWASLEVLFRALGRTANALDSLATVGEEKAAAYLDEARAERQAALAQLNKQLKLAAKADKVL